jgi:hypothetical protein
MDRALMADIHAARDEMQHSQLGKLVLEELPKSLGKVEHSLPEDLVNSTSAFLRSLPNTKSRLDANVFVPLVRMNAEDALDSFRWKLLDVFPEASVICDVNSMLPSDRFALLIAPIKNIERTLVKVRVSA